MGFLDIFKRKKKRDTEDGGSSQGRRAKVATAERSQGQSSFMAPPSTAIAPPSSHASMSEPPPLKQPSRQPNNVSMQGPPTSKMQGPSSTAQPLSESGQLSTNTSEAVTQEAEDVKDKKRVTLKIERLHWCSGGVFSNVYRGCVTSPERVEVAIKKTWPGDNGRSAEMIILAGMRRASPRNITRLLYRFKSRARDGVVCEAFVFEYMPQTLDKTIQDMHKDGSPLDFIDVKIYTWQIFNGLQFLAANHIVHRDIKPINILVNPVTGELQIADFGSAKVLIEREKSSAYQVTRYYRPPEMLLGCKYYNYLIDVWSAGCILGELLKGRVLFRGSDTAHQMQLVMRAFGPPTGNDLKKMKIKKAPRISAPPTQGIMAALHLQQDRLPPSTEAAVALLKAILVYDPESRLHGSALLNHSFFDDIKLPSTRRKNGLPSALHIIRQDSTAAVVAPSPRVDQPSENDDSCRPPPGTRHKEGVSQPPSCDGPPPPPTKGRKKKTRTISEDPNV